MDIDFKGLCAQLQLPKEYTSDAFHTLKKWCEESISRDIHFDEANKENYARYLALAETYLTEFLPHPHGNDMMDVVQYAAFEGYDHFLESLDNALLKTVNTKNDYGMTALHLAASKGNSYSAKALLSHGATLQINNQEQYPFHSVLLLPVIYDEQLVKNKIILFHLFESQSPELITAKDISGNTVAHLMASNGFLSLMEELIIAHPTLLFVSNNATKYPIHNAILNNQEAIVEALMTVTGMDIIKDAEQQIPLHYAAKYGTPQLITDCCHNKTLLNAKDDLERTPMLAAAKGGNLPTLQALFEKGADCNLADYEGFTILHYAVINQNISMITWILNNTSVDRNRSDREGKTALAYAKKDEIRALLQ